jgi:hypothetical protein
MRGFLCAVVAALLAGLAVGCVFGPRQLEKGHLAYNDAVKAAADDELLLNIVRLRYLDTLDFVAITSISSQLALSLSAGAFGGSDTVSGQAGASGRGDFSYSTRPTFTFTPQRGEEFAKRLIEPVGVDVLAYLVAADWDLRMLFRVLVRRVNGLDDELGLRNPEFREVTERLATLQMRNEIFVGFVSETEALSDPIEARRVSGTDLVEAARSGYRFESDGNSGFVLTAPRHQPVLALETGSEDAEAVMRLLRLVPDADYYDLVPGTRLGRPAAVRKTLSVRTGSLIRSLIYLSQGVRVPEAHVQEGLTTREWPPGSPGTSLDDLFQLHSARRKPDADLAVQHRGHWFYIADEDTTSRFTFFHLAEFFRIALSPQASQAAPVLTLPVGAP